MIAITYNTATCRCLGNQGSFDIPVIHCLPGLTFIDPVNWENQMIGTPMAEVQSMLPSNP